MITVSLCVLTQRWFSMAHHKHTCQQIFEYYNISSIKFSNGSLFTSSNVGWCPEYFLYNIRSLTFTIDHLIRVAKCYITHFFDQQPEDSEFQGIYSIHLERELLVKYYTKLWQKNIKREQFTYNTLVAFFDKSYGWATDQHTMLPLNYGLALKKSHILVAAIPGLVFVCSCTHYL